MDVVLKAKQLEHITFYPSDNVNAAMRDVYDIGEKLIFQPILLGEVARQVVENKDPWFNLRLIEGLQKIEWGIPIRNMTKEVISDFKVWGFLPNAKGWTYTFKGVPVQIIVINKRYNFFENLDTKFYQVDEFKIPNPFNKYLVARYIVQ